MPNIVTLAVLIFVGFLGWKLEIVNSAAIDQNNAPSVLSNDQLNDINTDVKLFQEAVQEYAEISHAFYSPAKDEGIREKRTIGVIRNIANRTRSGISTLRSLFSGGSSGSSGSGFRTFFSNFLNRSLIFLTNLWDRISGIFRRNGSNGSGGGILSRLSGILRGGSGGGGLFSIFRPTTTENPFSESDFYFSSSTTTDKPDDLDGLNNAVIGDAVSEVKDKGKNLDENENNTGDKEDDFIPFPGETETNSRTGKSLSESTNEKPQAVALVVKSGDSSDSASTTHVVKSPSIIHLIDDGRRFGV